MVKKLLPGMKGRNHLCVLALLCALGIAYGMWCAYDASEAEETEFVELQAYDNAFGLPVILSKQDRILYHDIFRAQKKTDWKKADRLIARLDDRALLGDVLAFRYLHRQYVSTPAELAGWLKRYGDLPAAYDIYTLARAKDPHVKAPLPLTAKSSVPQYGNDSDPSLWAENSHFTATWKKAISVWEHDKAQAARLFASLVDEDHPHSWKTAGAAFWAWRSYDALGDSKQGLHYLRVAARAPRSFYGILARKQLKQPLGLDSAPVQLSDSDVLEMIGEPAIRRILALSECNAPDMAEQELWHLFLQADKDDRMRLLALAHELNLASIQIAMARRLGSDAHPLDFARYPVPRWQPHLGFRVDPALIYALARQESGFHAAAVSPSGALGVMQLMPQTVSLMQKRLSGSFQDAFLTSASASEPVLNVTLGQGYVEHLLENGLVENNLLYMLTAYNAGPGRLLAWKKSIAYGDDPLLFLENIPFTETRNYVMQVMTNYWIYSELAGTPSNSLHALLQGHWPSYTPSVTPVAANVAASGSAG